MNDQMKHPEREAIFREIIRRASDQDRAMADLYRFTMRIIENRETKEGDRHEEWYDRNKCTSHPV